MAYCDSCSRLIRELSELKERLVASRCREKQLEGLIRWLNKPLRGLVEHIEVVRVIMLAVLDTQWSETDEANFARIKEIMERNK